MVSETHGVSQKSHEIKQDDKFFSRIMSKETSMANSSSRVYYGGASGSIPFMWESRPGTPKHKHADPSIPPLTPPPSYYFTSKSKSSQKNIKPSLLRRAIFLGLTPKKAHVSPSSSMSSTTTSSSWSSYCSSPANPNSPKFEKCRCFQCSRSSVHYSVDENEHGLGSPTSTLSYGVKRKAFNGFRNCYLMGNMKNAFLAFVGHGSG